MTSQIAEENLDEEIKINKKKYEITITPDSENSIFDEILNIFRNLDLLYILSTRDIKIRYKQTVIGILWVGLQPLIMSAIFTFIFSYMAKVDSPGIPYPIFVFSGLFLWQYINRVISESSDSLVANANIITKVFFPRMILPLIPALSATVDFIVAFIIFLGLSVIFNHQISISALGVIFTLLLTGILTYSLGLILAPINAIHRDVIIALPFAIQITMYLSPVVYPTNIVPEKFKWLYLFNPIATLLDMQRHFLLGTESPKIEAYFILLIYIIGLLIFGIKTFKKLEKTIVDKI